MGVPGLRLRVWWPTALAVSFLSVPISPSRSAEAEEAPLGPLHDVMLSATFSADGRHFAYVTPKAGKPRVLVRRAISRGRAVMGAGVVLDGSRRRTVDGVSGATVAAVIDGREGPEYQRIESLVICGDRVAYVATRTEGTAMVVDGREEALFDDVREPVFSEAGRRLAYAARRGIDWFVVVDGEEGPVYEGVSAPVFSPDGGRIAHAALSGEKWFVVVDGQAGPSFDVPPAGRSLRSLVSDADDIVFSPGGQRVPYLAPRGRRKVVVVDGQEWPGEGEVGRPIFSPDGSRVAWLARKESEGWQVVVDGQAAPPGGHISHLTFSPDGQHMAYVLTHYMGDGYAGSSTVVLDGDEQGPYEPMRPERHELVFSPDSRHLAYLAETLQERRPVAVLDGEEQALVPDRSRTLLFSPRSQLVYAATGQHQFLVADGVPGPAYYSIAKGSICFTADGSRVAYVARKLRTSEYVVVVDGEEGTGYGDIPGGTVLFSPNGQRFAYVARADAGFVTVVDGAEGQVHDDIIAESLTFDASGKHFAYAAKQEGAWSVAVDEAQGPSFDGIVPNGPCFRRDGTLEYLAHREGVLYRVRHVVGEGG